MPKCKKCEDHFPNRIIIDGKERNLHKRKYCLNCSPFGAHNTKKIHIGEKKEICKYCGKKFIYDRNKGHRVTVCNSCHSNRKRFRLKRKMIEYKGGRCQLKTCSTPGGYARERGAMHFHHIDPKTKSFAIGGNHCRKWETLKKELDKCILVCANCHSEIHAGIAKI